MLAAFDVLVFSKTAEFQHDSIDEGVAAIEALGAAHNFSVTYTEDAAQFTEANLAQYEAVVFLLTTGDVLDDTQQVAFEHYIEAGGGYVGVHSAADTEHSWAWYGNLVGAFYTSHSNVVQATIEVADHVNPSTAGLPDRWVRTDEWFNYSINPRGNVQVLATVDESTYTGGTMGFDHPISWYHYFDGGRSWYTGLGHTESSYSEPLFLDHLLGGIQFAAGQAPADLGASVNANWHKTDLATGLSNPVAMSIAPTGEVYFIQFGGAVKIYNPATNMTTTAGTVPVYNEGEDGMLAIALDPNFAENGWVYLYFSPAAPGVGNRLSRFTITGGVLDLNSEIELLTVGTDRTADSMTHSGGSLAFGPDGLLYLSTGDDTNPFQSNGYDPIDERAGRSDFDAQRSAGNTQDLRGKILRIRPEADGTYSIPDGNLFPSDGSVGRPEIYVMGDRNPYRISIDPVTGWLYWGEVGPDAGGNSATRGPQGYDEINQAREAGFYGWPYFIADNKAYRDYNFATGVSGPAFNPAAPVNDSPNNTGAVNLPPAKGAFIWYPYSNSTEFPELNGGSGRTAMAGPVYHFDPAVDSSVKLPEYLDGALIIYEWSRNKFWEVQMDDDGQILKINQIFVGLSFVRPIEAELGPDGALYVIEWGTNFGGGNANAKLVRIEFTGNLPTLLGDYNGDHSVNAADYTVWRNSLGQTGLTPFSGADANGDGKVTMSDYNIWKTHYGETVPSAGAGAGALNQSAASAGDGGLAQSVAVSGGDAAVAAVVAEGAVSAQQEVSSGPLSTGRDLSAAIASVSFDLPAIWHHGGVAVRRTVTPAPSHGERLIAARDAALLLWLDSRGTSRPAAEDHPLASDDSGEGSDVDHACEIGAWDEMFSKTAVRL